MVGATARAEPTEVPRSNRSSWKWINKTVIIVGVAGVVALTVAARIYEQVYAWKAGLDATAPEFQTYWMHMLYAIFAFEAILSAGLWGYVWFSRPKDLGHLEPREELRRVGVAVSMIFVYVFAVFIGASFFAEQDATWHQTVVRDTSFTPSHIMLFYGSFPLFIILGIAAYLYMRTRLPRFAARHSLPFLIAVTGPFMLLPVVGYNEWAHSYLILEERFAAPVHAAFMLFAWTGLGLGGLLLQFCDYIYELTTGKAQSYEKGVPASDPALDFEQEHAVKFA
jgi:methane/ammonia monooxygenase subunit C